MGGGGITYSVVVGEGVGGRGGRGWRGSYQRMETVCVVMKDVLMASQ